MKDEKCSFSPILDCFNNERIAYGLSRRPSARNAITSGGKITENYEFDINSDQGIHYQMPSYQRLLAKNRISQSMSRKGNCLDNVAMESFLGE